jgi:hypothetical protein
MKNGFIASSTVSEVIEGAYYRDPKAYTVKLV